MMTLLYRSDAVALLPFSALADICVTSARANRRLGITGFLVERDGVFLQVLEGEAGVVEPLFARIAVDPRHCNVTVIDRKVGGPGRLFGFWAMNVGPLDNPSLLSGSLEPLRDAAAFRRGIADADTALAVLTRAYAFARKVAVTNPVIGDFMMGGV
ncbi:BLUF domain-containing protein [Azospirillum sp. TSO35-2]|uniref:BLUF domain-containing protein n=1 Tax=Azospirillum sp. TSO35-2 TaxID=716796 RepID=UPI000D645979|nr:BLUF domain-containing protein [Azospirillum sp. TSO35-2]